MRSGRPVVIVFARAPRLGAVKTRLAAGIGRRAALRFYIETTRNVLRRVHPAAGWDSLIAMTPDIPGRIDCFWPNPPDLFGQGRGDLGQRMERAMLRFPDRPIAIIGSDIPDLSAEDLQAAFGRLGTNDFVFGPADDGGYWLVGARRGALARGMFRNVRWSGPHALADTMANVKNRGVARLRTLADIDTADDFHRWRANGG